MPCAHGQDYFFNILTQLVELKQNNQILGGNETSVYRFNISVNDGWRSNPNWVNSNHTIWLSDNIGGQDGYNSENSYIYNNTVVINRSSDKFI